jgi:hypothetical protein
MVIRLQEPPTGFIEIGFTQKLVSCDVGSSVYSMKYAIVTQAVKLKRFR